MSFVDGSVMILLPASRNRIRAAVGAAPPPTSRPVANCPHGAAAVYAAAVPTATTGPGRGHAAHHAGGDAVSYRHDMAGVDPLFTPDEYEERRRRVRTEMQLRGVDSLLVLSPANLNYLTGFESVWYPPRAPVGCMLRSDGPPLVFLDYERHQHHVEQSAVYDQAVFYTYQTAVAAIADALERSGACAGSVGIEWWTPAPGAPLVRGLADALAARGARIVAGDWIVDRVRLVKSAVELDCLRRAGGIVDEAFRQIATYIRPGRTELQVAAQLNAIMADLGGEEAAIRTMVSAGPRVWCSTHAAPSRRALERGDVIYLDACGVYRRYHADLCRTFVLGQDHPAVRDILEYTSGSVERVRRSVRIGDPLDVAQRAAEDYIYARFHPDQVWWVGGYALGIALPPSWVGHTYLSNDAFESFTWQPGYVTNYENIIYDREAGYTASYMETLVMTSDGVAALSQLPRTLTVIPC